MERSIARWKVSSRSAAASRIALVSSASGSPSVPSAPLTMPPDFNLRPPQPGAARPQEKSSEQQARQAIEQAGPGEPGKQAPDFRLRRDLRVNLGGAAIIVDLVEQLEGLERELARRRGSA